METTFIIQASAPRALQICNEHDDSLCAALETVFPLYTEDIIMNWNHVYVPISYKYDLSVMMDDVLQIIEALQNTPQGKLVNHWASNTFAATWKMDWNDGILKVHSEWISVVGETEALLASRPDIQMPSEDFVAEWMRPLHIAEHALSDAGYTVSQLPGLARLRTVRQLRVREGVLYREQ